MIGELISALFQILFSREQVAIVLRDSCKGHSALDRLAVQVSLRGLHPMLRYGQVACETKQL